MEENKYKVGFNQRLPLDVMAEALRMCLEDCWDDQSLRETLQTEYEGENRIKKAIAELKTTVARSVMMPILQENKDAVLKALKNKNDRNVILTAIVNARSPFCYDVTTALASQFRLQDEINTDLLTRLIGKKYGYNKSILNTLYRVVPQLIEGGMIVRPKTGLFQPAPAIHITYDITKTLWRESFYVNNPLWNRNNTEDLIFEPYFRYIAE